MFAKPGNRLLLRIAEYKVNGKDITNNIQNSVSIYNFTEHEAVLYNKGERVIIYPNTGYSFERPDRTVSILYNGKEFTLDRSHFRKKMNVLSESEKITDRDLMWTERIWMKDIWDKSDLMVPNLDLNELSFIQQEGSGNYPVLILGLIFLFILVIALIIVFGSNKIYSYLDENYVV